MSFKEKTGRIRNWCREHKTDIIITAAGIAGGAVVCYGVKKTVDITKVALENSRQRNEEAFRDFEVGMFVNGIRKQFLGCGGDEFVDNVTESVEPLKSICGERGLCGLRNGENVLVMAQGVAAENSDKVVGVVKDAFSGIDNLEIWVAGTVKE